ncbi:NAD(P)-binding protein [Mytilinidion resinicola]|uniref:NAD(P)-binding protein n=1 Tax=Mytilinidion resinicola TaxID=574789 RepID=A0A6A6YL82_9PEZI|nr:NAD(P)-binding protein [Mytilinidion resinicola]KAF2808627.1 NAD(P)-binding protein [Mytilinidion resinicola]
MAKQRILVLGATGGTGLAFIKEALVHASQPNLTLLIRTPSKVSQEYRNNSRITIVKGELNDRIAVEKALQGVTAVVSFLGPYMTLKATLLRDTSTPIADSLPTLFTAMRSANITRMLALSTPTGLPQPTFEEKSWSWWAAGWFIYLVAPQGNAEMTKIGKLVSSQTDLEWTVFRVPSLTNGSADKVVEVGYLGGKEFNVTAELTRGSLARWVLGEVEGKEWVGRAPAVANGG